MSMNDERPPLPPAARRKPGANKRLANGLVALSTAATIAIYAAGYARTAPAAAQAVAPPSLAAIVVVPTATATATATAVPPTATATIPVIATAAAPSPTATQRATATATATIAATTAALRDGTYSGTGTSRHGSITVAVVVQGGKIVSAEITNCGTRYPCSKIAALPGQVVSRQSAAVDTVSGSTDSSTAYRSAVTAALAQAH